MPGTLPILMEKWGVEGQKTCVKHASKIEVFYKTDRVPKGIVEYIKNIENYYKK